MPDNTIPYDFSDLFTVVNQLKNCLQDDFQQLYVQAKAVNKSTDTIADEQLDPMPLFQIPKGVDSIFAEITSAAQLSETKTLILTKYETFIDHYVDYFERVKHQLDPQVIDSLAIIRKLLKNRRKKLASGIKKFRIEDSWNVQRTKTEFQILVTKHLKDIIENTIRPIAVGIKHNPVYEAVLKQLNVFLAELGIHTRMFAAGATLVDEDWPFITPIDCDDCETNNQELKNVIKAVLTYPYIIDENDIVLEGNVVVWRITR